MYLLKAKEDGRVYEVIKNAPASLEGFYVEAIPQIELNQDEIARLYIINGTVEVRKEKR